MATLRRDEDRTATPVKQTGGGQGGQRDQSDTKTANMTSLRGTTGAGLAPLYTAPQEVIPVEVR